LTVPTDYSPSSAYDLLKAASRGLLGLDRRLLHALVDDPPRSLPGVVRFAAEDHDHDPLDLLPELLAVFRRLKTPEALPFYVQCLRTWVEDAEDDLIEGVIALGHRALEPLLKLYEELGEEQGGEVAFILAGLGVRDDRVLRILLDRLEYDVTDGGMCLGLYGDPAAVAAIEKMKAEVGAEDVELRRELQNAIDEIASHGSETGEAAADFDLFDGYPETAGPDFDVLSAEDRLRLLSHESPEFRAAAARSFFEQEYGADVRARLLELAGGDVDAQVRGRAWEALSGIDDKDLRARMLTVATNAQADVAERAGALVALADDADKPEVRTAMIGLYELPEARAKALEAMWRSFDRGFSAYFPAHVDDPDEAIRRQAIFGVGYLGIGSEAERLRKYFDDEHWRPDALYAWALSTPAEITRGRIRGLFRKIDRTAGGLSAGESELVQLALDQRLLLHGLEPVFFPDAEEEHVHDEHCDHDHAPAAAPAKEVGRNDPCPCGSGKKYKKCCGAPQATN
jgi:hypothetical protein